VPGYRPQPTETIEFPALHFFVTAAERFSEEMGIEQAPLAGIAELA